MLLDNYSLEIISNNSFKFGEMITSIRLFFALSDSSTGKNSPRPPAIIWDGVILELFSKIWTTDVALKTDSSQLFFGDELLFNLSVSVCPSTIISRSFSDSSALPNSTKALTPSSSTNVLPDLKSNFASKLT